MLTYNFYNKSDEFLFCINIGDRCTNLTEKLMLLACQNDKFNQVSYIQFGRNGNINQNYKLLIEEFLKSTNIVRTGTQIAFLPTAIAKTDDDTGDDGDRWYAGTCTEFSNVENGMQNFYVEIHEKTSPQWEYGERTRFYRNEIEQFIILQI